MIRITLCPNCRSIQKAGTTCSICNCPVDLLPRKREETPGRPVRPEVQDKPQRG